MDKIGDFVKGFFSFFFVATVIPTPVSGFDAYIDRVVEVGLAVISGIIVSAVGHFLTLKRKEKEWEAWQKFQENHPDSNRRNSGESPNG
ncbi:MAG: hypothetical protein R2759_00030 [Bacteroidales bacterium]